MRAAILGTVAAAGALLVPVVVGGPPFAASRVEVAPITIDGPLPVAVGSTATAGVSGCCDVVAPLECVFGADTHTVAVVPTATVESASLISIPSLRDAPKYLFSGAKRY
jgi:hypothetical protein